ncbi:hypothetical protein [Flagellimonas sp. SN16]|uniref:hypothetical protein n=1 Tax=Flagellimonas sp. SN16 TaxID=3415142 RepID=UPI003C409EB7
MSKSTYRENKDLSVFQQNDILSSILVNKLDTQIVFEPINTAIPIKINDSTSISNARVVISVKKTDSTVINRDSSTVKVKDKGEVYSSTKTKNIDKEKKVQVLWWQWVIIIGGILIGVLYLKARGRKLF